MHINKAKGIWKGCLMTDNIFENLSENSTKRVMIKDVLRQQEVNDHDQ